MNRRSLLQGLASVALLGPLARRGFRMTRQLDVVFSGGHAIQVYADTSQYPMSLDDYVTAAGPWEPWYGDAFELRAAEGLGDPVPAYLQSSAA